MAPGHGQPAALTAATPCADAACRGADGETNWDAVIDAEMARRKLLEESPIPCSECVALLGLTAAARSTAAAPPGVDSCPCPAASMCVALQLARRAAALPACPHLCKPGGALIVP